MVLICIAGLLLFGWMTVSPYAFEPASALTRGAGIFGVCLFTILLLVNLRQAGYRGNVISIGPQGLLWSRWSEERIRWDAIQAARLASTRGEEVLRLWLEEPGAAQPRSILGRVAPINRWLGAGDLELSTTGTDRKFQEMIEAIQTFAPHLLAPEPGTRERANLIERQARRAEDSSQLHEKGIGERDSTGVK
jgi:hypothetical protein